MIATATSIPTARALTHRRRTTRNRPTSYAKVAASKSSSTPIHVTLLTIEDELKIKAVKILAEKTFLVYQI